jgi:hypothetical protein
LDESIKPHVIQSDIYQWEMTNFCRIKMRKYGKSNPYLPDRLHNPFFSLDTPFYTIYTDGNFDLIFNFLNAMSFEMIDPDKKNILSLTLFKGIFPILSANATEMQSLFSILCYATYYFNQYGFSPEDRFFQKDYSIWETLLEISIEFNIHMTDPKGTIYNFQEKPFLIRPTEWNDQTLHQSNMEEVD